MLSRRRQLQHAVSTVQREVRTLRVLETAARRSEMTPLRPRRQQRDSVEAVVLLVFYLCPSLSDAGVALSQYCSRERNAFARGAAQQTLDALSRADQHRVRADGAEVWRARGSCAKI